MKIKKYRLLCLAITISIIIIVLCGCGKQSQPTIEYGEFPFLLKYKLNDEIYEIQDTVICQFSGYDYSAWFTKPRTWDEYLSSGTKRISILKDEDVNSILNPKRINTEIEVYFNYGYGSYYMGDPNSKSQTGAKPQISYVETYKKSPKETVIEVTELTNKQLKEHFNIEILELNTASPIKNTFR